jgi:3-isopropylmalate/(R)-2-methylmalate dehydratase small subunit
MRIVGRAWVFGDRISTDVLYPQFAYKLQPDEARFAVMEAIRPGWSRMVEAGDLLVAGENFGIGSARPVALLLRRLGVAACVAESFSPLFFRNCINAGLPVLSCRGVSAKVHEGSVIEVDLAAGTVVADETLMQGTPIPDELLDILRSGGVKRLLVDQGFLRAGEPQ